MKHPNVVLIERFYTAFQKVDYTAMNACYHPQAQFSDAAFTDLDGKQVRAMWHMLCSASRDLQLTFSAVTADDGSGSCHWEAIYTFSKTGRKVHNRIDAEFVFKDGLIYHHRDAFDLWAWAGMALGPTGKLLGWTPLLQNKIRGQAMNGLHKFIGKHPEYA